MTTTTYHMRNALEAVDDMVLMLKAEVRHALPAAAVLRFEICMAEVLANIVKHAHTTQPDTPIEIVLSQSANTLLAEIFDPEDAVFFDLRDHANDLETLDPLSESGRGLGLILQCADRVEYGTSNGRTLLSLSFK